MMPGAIRRRSILLIVSIVAVTIASCVTMAIKGIHPEYMKWILMGWIIYLLILLVLPEHFQALEEWLDVEVRYRKKTGLEEYADWQKIGTDMYQVRSVHELPFKAELGVVCMVTELHTVYRYVGESGWLPVIGTGVIMTQDSPEFQLLLRHHIQNYIAGGGNTHQASIQFETERFIERYFGAQRQN